MLKQSLRFSGLPESLQAKIMGCPKAAITKERIATCVSPDVSDLFRATGKGWQTRMDDALRDWVKTHATHQ